MKKENIRIKWLNQLLKRHDSSMEIAGKVVDQSQNDLLSRINRSLHTMGVDTKGLKYRREELYQR